MSNALSEFVLRHNADTYLCECRVAQRRAGRTEGAPVAGGPALGLPGGGVCGVPKARKAMACYLAQRNAWDTHISTLLRKVAEVASDKQQDFET